MILQTMINLNFPFIIAFSDIKRFLSKYIPFTSCRAAFSTSFLTDRRNSTSVAAVTSLEMNTGPR